MSSNVKNNLKSNSVSNFDDKTTKGPPPPYMSDKNEPMPVVAQPISTQYAPIGPQRPFVPQPYFIAPPVFGKYPQACTCPNCRNQVVSRIDHQVGTGTWAFAGAICLGGLLFGICLCGCQFIPFCIDDCKDVLHYCPNCNTFLGERKVM